LPWADESQPVGLYGQGVSPKARDHDLWLLIALWAVELSDSLNGFTSQRNRPYLQIAKPSRILLVYWARMAKVYDIAILGATPAGLAAGYRLASDGCSVVLVDSPAAGDECPLNDWVPADLFGLKGIPKSLARRCAAEPFRAVKYHNVDLDRQTEHRSRSVLGYFLHPDKLRQVLASDARKAGVSFRKASTLPDIELLEDGVVLSAARTTRARLLLLAGGSASAAVGHLSMPNGGPSPPNLGVAGLDIPLSPAGVKTIADKALHVIEAAARTDLRICFVSGKGKKLHVRVLSESRGPGPGVGELSDLLGSLQSAGLIPDRLALGKATGAFWRPQAGVAMEMNSHTAKRCLLIGSAGGFAASVTGQTLYPSICSALLAARCAATVIQRPSNVLHDQLLTYKSAWRKALGQYLCPPDTSLQMLIPLLFANKRVVPRFTRSLLRGDRI